MDQDPEYEKRLYDTTNHMIDIYEEKSDRKADAVIIEICRSIAGQVEAMSDFFGEVFRFEEGDED